MTFYTPPYHYSEQILLLTVRSVKTGMYRQNLRHAVPALPF